MPTQTIGSTFVDAFNRHDGAAFAAFYAPDAVVVDPQHSDPLTGTKAITADVDAWFGAFPDIEARIEREVVSGSDYAIAFSMRGTHKGSLLMPGGNVPATDKPIQIAVATIGRMNPNGRIVEERRYYDLAGVMTQLGLME
jgi:steroid delta-isomerase-like uncharacterized protein